MRIDMFTSVLLFGIVLTSAGDAQLCGVREYGWTNAVGGEDYDILHGLVADSSGRVYVTGAFHDRVDFRPDKKRDRHKAKGGAALFLSSYAADGSYRWTLSLSHPAGSIAAGGLGASYADDIVVAGQVSGKMDFRAGPGRDIINSYDSANDAFVSVYTSTGTQKWARIFRGPGNDVARAAGVDASGKLFITGNYSQWTDFDPSHGKDIHMTDGEGSTFVTKLSQDGSYAWTRTFPGNGLDYGEAIAAGPDGEVVAVGIFRGETDFDPSEGVDLRRTAGETDIFAVKLNAEGTREWAYTIGGVDYDFVRGVAIDDDGFTYVVGSFRFTVEFDPDSGGELRHAEGLDAYMVKLSPSGAVVWVRVFTGPGIEAAHGVALRPDGLMAVSGTFTESADFDPSDGVDWRASRGVYDAFIALLTIDGDYVGVETFGGTDRSGETARTITFDPDGNLVAAGTFDSSDCDFDPTTGIDLRAGTNDDPDVFTTKLYCGSCTYVERHSIELKAQRKLKAEVRALIPGGRATVECTPTDPPGEPIETRVNIDGDNTGKYKLKKLAKGEYACAITEVRDAEGDIVCDEPAGKRVVNVK